MKPPQSIGPYELSRPLDQRSDHRVFLVAVDGGSTEAVLERAPLAESGGPEEREATRSRFFEQAARWSTLEHPALVRLIDHGEEREVLWWVSERVEGIPLSAYLGGGEPLDRESAVELIALAAEALDAVHAASVVHGAIRPSRLLRTGGGRLKIVGFRPGNPGGDPLKRAAGGVAGYLAPEQIRGREIDGRADLFSLAVVLFELLTGAHPFPGESESSTLYRIVHEDPCWPATERGRLEEDLRSMLLRGLARNPGDRYPTGATFAEALRRAGAGASVDAALGGGASAAPAAGAAGGAAAAPSRRARPPRRSATTRFVVGALAVLTVAAGWVWLSRDRIVRPPEPPPPVWLEAEVRTQPEGLDVMLDGEPLDPPGVVRFQSREPYPLLTTALGCRTAEHRLGPEDAGTVVVLVTDPLELSWSFESPIAGAELLVEGKSLGPAPQELRLDLCEPNVVELRAKGYYPAVAELPAGATPLDARKQLFELELREIPTGRLELPKADIQLVYYVDGRRLKPEERELELEEGEHEVRYKNEYHWVDRRVNVEIKGDETATVKLDGARLTTLLVQAFPANCKVYVRQGGGSWRYIDETPARRQVAPGSYEVKVVLNPTGEEQVRQVELVPGDNPPVRIAFRGRG